MFATWASPQASTVASRLLSLAWPSFGVAPSPTTAVADHRARVAWRVPASSEVTLPEINALLSARGQEPLAQRVPTRLLSRRHCHLARRGVRLAHGLVRFDVAQ